MTKLERVIRELLNSTEELSGNSSIVSSAKLQELRELIDEADFDDDEHDTTYRCPC